MPNDTLKTPIVDSDAYNIALAAAYIAGPIVLAYFAAPYLAMATRIAFPIAYRALVGTPSVIGHYTTYVPAREKACSLVYNNAPAIVGAASTAIQAAKQALHAGFSFFTTKTAPSASSQAHVNAQASVEQDHSTTPST